MEEGLLSSHQRLVVFEVAQFILEQVAQVRGGGGIVVDVLTEATGFVIAHELFDGEGNFAFGGINADDFGFVRLADLDDLQRIFDVIAAELADVDEAFYAVFDAGESAEFSNFRNFAIDDRPRGITIGEGFPGIVCKLFNTEAEAFVGDIDIEDDGFDFVAFFVDFGGVTNFLSPADIGDMDETVDAVFDADEEAEIGDIANFAFNDGADRIFFLEDFPGIGFGLFHAEANFLRIGIEAEDDDIDDIADIDHTAGVLTRFVQLISLIWMRPSMPSSSSTKAP